MGLAHHSLNISFLAWICLYPLLDIIHRLSSYKTIIKYFFLWGISYSLVSLFWLATNVGTTVVIATLLMFLTVLYLSVNFILIGIIWFRLKKTFNEYSIVILAIVWTCIEFIKSYGILAFPWISIANTQTDYFYLIQIAEYTGIYGVTFWVVLVNFRTQFLPRSFYLLLLFLLFFGVWVTYLALVTKILLLKLETKKSLQGSLPNI